jgi:hypothetical protein
MRPEPEAAIDAELELITSSLLPAERLVLSDENTWPRTVDITSDDSDFSLHITLLEGYPDRDAVRIDVKGSQMGRDEAGGWKSWIEGTMDDWTADECVKR